MPVNPHYEIVLADLEQMKKDAEDGIRAIKQLMARSGQVVADQEAEPAKPVRPPQRNDMPEAMAKSVVHNTAALVRGAFTKQPHRVFTVKDLASVLGLSDIKTIGATVFRLTDRGFIKKVSRGHYRLKVTAQKTAVSERERPQKGLDAMGRPKTVRGDLANGARAAVATLSGSFDAREVLRMMENNSYQFSVRDRLSAVNGALRRLARDGVVKVVAKGKGSQGNRFKTIAEESQQISLLANAS